jgi:hypothetical protein
MPPDGSVAPIYSGTFINNSAPTKMQFYQYTQSGATYDAIAILFGNGDLVRVEYNGFSQLAKLATGVSDFAIRTSANLGFGVYSEIYATTGQSGIVGVDAPAGQLFRIDPVANTSKLLYTAESKNQLLSVETDGDDLSNVSNIYISEGIVTCGSIFCTITDIAIRRHTALVDGGAWVTPLLTGGGVNVRSDTQFLYFMRQASPGVDEIVKIPTDAPAQEIQIQAIGFDVVQSIQDFNNSVTLVANRQTFARGFAWLTKNTTGIPQWFPDVALRGFQNGVELPGSPISPINNAYIDNTNELAVLRSDTNRCFLFELPPSWVAPSGLPLDLMSFSMTVNPQLGIAETGPNPLSDNTSTSGPLAMIQKGFPCVIPISVMTTGPLYDPPYAPDFGQQIERARTLMPVEDFSVFAYTVPVPLGDPDNPYNMNVSDYPTQSKNADQILGDIESVQSSHQLDGGVSFNDPCANSGDEHYMGTLSLQAVYLPGIFGDSRGICSWTTMNTGSFSGHAPGGGEDMAHEFGHNYGRKHIPCGNFPADQANFDTVQFPGSIGDPNEDAMDATFGWDTMTYSIITPNSGCDTMSYNSTKWVTKDYWEALLPKTAGPASAASVREPMLAMRHARMAGADAPLLLVSGRVDAVNGLVEFQNFIQIPESAAPSNRVAESRSEAIIADDDAHPYLLRELDNSGMKLLDTALFLKEASIHGLGAAEFNRFGQYVDYDPATRRIQVVHDEMILAERFVSAHAPVVTLNPIALDVERHSLTFSWQASDADGDPLRFLIQFSADDGVHWTVVQVNYKALATTIDTMRLPGAQHCHLRVIASDGVNSAIAATPAFSLPRHAPSVQIYGVNEGDTVPFGVALRLTGAGYEPEVSTRGIQLAWDVSGPDHRTGTNSALSLTALSPGAYVATLTATDPAGLAGTAVRHFEVGAVMVPDGAAPRLDGMPHDATYAGAAFISVPQGNGAMIPARLIHANGALYVSFANLSYSSGRGLASIGLRVDTGDTQSPAAGTGDIGFFVDETGVQWQEMPDGGSMVETFSPQPGFTAMIFRGGNAWNAEFRISDSLLGGWNHRAGIMIGGRGLWPIAAAGGQPSSWAAAVFGAVRAAANHPPIADAGPDQTWALGISRNLYLDGQASHDPDGNPLSYHWSQVSGPAVQTENTTNAIADFTAPVVTNRTQLVFQLIVNDGFADSVPAHVAVTLNPSPARQAVTVPMGFAGVGADGMLELRLVTNDPNQMFNLQVSTDLANWRSFRAAIADANGIIDFTAPSPSTDLPHLFFRAVLPQ